MVKTLLPQEIEVFYILPAIRREIAKAMKLKGHTQKEISIRLGVTEAAISQYLSDKRASSIDFSNTFKEDIKEKSKSITSPFKLIEISRYLLDKAKDDLTTCNTCKKFSSVTMPDNCKACFKDPYEEVIDLLDEYDKGSPKKEAGFDH